MKTPAGSRSWGRASTGFTAGDPVIVYGPVGVWAVRALPDGHGELLPDPRRPVPAAWGPTAAWPNTCLSPSTRFLIPLGNLDPREAAPLERRRTDQLPRRQTVTPPAGAGSTAVVIGAGGLGQMAIQILRALSAATTIVAVDTSADKLDTAARLGADEGLLSGDDTVQRIKDMTGGQGAELVLDLVGDGPHPDDGRPNGPRSWAPDHRRCGTAALPVNFHSPPHECSVTSPYWGSIPELIEVITLAQTGKIQMLVEHFTLDHADEAYQLLHDGKIRGRAVITPHP